MKWDIVTHPERLQAFLERGGDPNTMSFDQRTPKCDYAEGWLGILECLPCWLVNTVSLQCYGGSVDGFNTMYAPACVVKGVDADRVRKKWTCRRVYKDQYGSGTLLHYAVYFAIARSTRLLIDYGADLTATTKRGGKFTPYQLAADHALKDRKKSLMALSPEVFLILERYTALPSVRPPPLSGKRVRAPKSEEGMRRDPLGPVGIVPASSPRPVNEKFDAFLTHNWGEKGENHVRVSEINAFLKRNSIKTWFDEERLRDGSLSEAMSTGIDHSMCIIVFITKAYMDKVDGKSQAGANDNCKLEFTYAVRRKQGVAGTIAVVMEDDCRNQSQWMGPVGLFLGDSLYLDLSPSVTGEQREANLKKLVEQIKAIAR